MVKVEGLNKKLHTAQSIKDFSVEEQLIKSNDWEAIDRTLRIMLI